MLQRKLNDYKSTTETILVSNREQQRIKILKVLKSRLFVPTAYLSTIAYQYNARIYELRHGLHDGTMYKIKSIKQNDSWGYGLE